MQEPSELAPQPGESLAVTRVALKMPPFWARRPLLWFSQVEACFKTAGITNEETKYYYVVSALDQATAEQLADLIENMPQTAPYQTLKETAIRRFSDSGEQKLRSLLTGMELGDQRPSQLLRAMRDLARGALSDDALKTLWLQRLPIASQTALSASKDELDQLAELADRVQDIVNSSSSLCSVSPPAPAFPGSQVAQNPPPHSLDIHAALATLAADIKDLKLTVASVQRSRHSRMRSASRDRSDDRPFCWYHWRFGASAKRCTPPCSYTSSDQGNASSHR